MEEGKVQQCNSKAFIQQKDMPSRIYEVTIVPHQLQEHQVVGRLLVAAAHSRHSPVDDSTLPTVLDSPEHLPGKAVQLHEQLVDLVALVLVAAVPVPGSALLAPVLLELEQHTAAGTAGNTQPMRPGELDQYPVAAVAAAELLPHTLVGMGTVPMDLMLDQGIPDHTMAVVHQTWLGKAYQVRVDQRIQVQDHISA